MTTATPATPDTRVVRAAIHPAIGIARVGDSRDEYYFGPEVCDLPSESLAACKRAAPCAEAEAASWWQRHGGRTA
jgi:hypothetical protein